MKFQLKAKPRKMAIYAENEISRIALVYAARSELLPQKSRMMAQFRLQDMSRDTCRTHIRLTCTETNRARSILKNFGINRVILRDKMLAGLIPGWKRAIW